MLKPGDFITHPLLEELGLPHGFATAKSPPEAFDIPDPRELEAAKYADLHETMDRALAFTQGRSNAILTVKQTHSTYILEVRRSDALVPAAERIQCDALVTDRPGLLVAVKTADCLPVLLAAPERGVVAAVHAGWRGAYRGILHLTLQRMIHEFGCRAADIRVVFGPCARRCCYEVDTELGAVFAERFGPDVLRHTEPRPFLDLVEASRRQATRLGLSAAHIGEVEACTICTETPRFHSYRRDKGRTGRLVNMIGLPGQPDGRNSGCHANDSNGGPGNG